MSSLFETEVPEHRDYYSYAVMDRAISQFLYPYLAFIINQALTSRLIRSVIR
jgi:hypothetical protein